MTLLALRLVNWAGRSPDVGASKLVSVLRAARLPRAAEGLDRSASG
jgi:hypothetical protein